jgi:hypothetical protein
MKYYCVDRASGLASVREEAAVTPDQWCLPQDGWYRQEDGSFSRKVSETPATAAEVWDASRLAHRIEAYPALADQIDAIFKGFAHLKAAGVDIGPAASAWVTQIQQIKAAWPTAVALPA